MADTWKKDLWKGVKHPRMRPWMAVAAELPASVGAHALWGDSPVAAVGLTVAAGVLTATTWWAGEGTKAPRRLHATLSTAAATSYLVVGTVANPLDPALLSTLLIGGSVGAGGWNIRQALRVNPDAKKDGESGETSLLEKSLGKAKAALRSQPKVEPNKVTAPYQLAKGELTNADLGNRINQMASELGISPNSIRIAGDPENASQGEFVFTPVDMLKKSTPYPGPQAVGGSIVDAIVVGLYEDGTPAVLWFPAAPEGGRNATHFLAAGMNGSAKSTGVSVAMTEALTRRDVIVWGVDPSKGMQTFAAFLPYLDWVEMTEAGGEAMIDALSQVITARADELGRHGFKNWTPDAFAKLGMPYMIVWIEEAAKFFRNGTEMEGLVMEARSAGISVIISLQRPSATSMPTDVREQLGGVICFGVKGGTTADMALPEDVRDAGARPEAWENRKPGYAYLVAPGVDEERYPVPLRTYMINDDQISAALAPVPRVSADPVTAQAAGEAYANRRRYEAETALTSIEPKETAMPKEGQQAAEEATLERQVNRDIAARVGDGEPEPDLSGIDPDKEIPAVPSGQVWTFGQADEPAREKTPDEALAELMKVLEECREENRETVGPRDFKPYGKSSRIGRSRAWISEALNNLADEGVHIEETETAGTYKLLYPEAALTPA